MGCVIGSERLSFCEKCNIVYDPIILKHCCECKFEYPNDRIHCCNCKTCFRENQDGHCCSCGTNYLLDSYHCLECHRTSLATKKLSLHKCKFCANKKE